MAKIMELATAIRENVNNSDLLVMEGFTHLIPHAAAHEVIRQGYKDLTLSRMTPDLIYDQLIGMGRVKKLIFSYAGNPGVGLLLRFRDAVENQWPRALEIEEHSHAAMANAYEAGAAGLPCAVFRGYRGAGLTEVNPNIKSIECPFTGEKLAAVPALNADVAIIHAQRANKNGDVLLEGIIGVQKEAVLGAKRAVVTVEEIVDDFGDISPNAVVLPSWTINAVVVIAGGAHPSYAHGYYSRDNGFYKDWDRISRDRDVFLEWMDENVMKSGPQAFEVHVKKGPAK
jgi:glutaconate CoA-transferase subunit A